MHFSREKPRLCFQTRRQLDENRILQTAKYGMVHITHISPVSVKLHTLKLEAILNS